MHQILDRIIFNWQKFNHKEENFLFIRDVNTIAEIYETWNFILEKHFAPIPYSINLKLDWNRII
jgi:hypothetical protein